MLAISEDFLCEPIFTASLAVQMVVSGILMTLVNAKKMTITGIEEQ
jgi:hypothetical protein